MLLKLVRIFGSMIYSAISASSSVGVDIEAEQRSGVLKSSTFSKFSNLKLHAKTQWLPQVGTLQLLLCGTRKS